MYLEISSLHNYIYVVAMRHILFCSTCILHDCVVDTTDVTCLCYCRGETVSVPKGGDLPRPSVVNIIGGSSVKSEVPPPSEYHEQQYPISSKEVIAITPKANRYEEESCGTTTTALQPNNPNNPSSSLKKTTYPVVLKRENEQQGSNGSDVVEFLLSPHFKRERSLEMDNDDMDFDLEDVVEEPQEKRVKGVAAVTKTTSTVSSIDQPTCHEKEGGEDKTSTLHGCKRQRIVYPEVERETVTDSFSLNDDEMVLEFSSSSPHLKDSASCANIKRNVEDEVNESTLSCHNTSTTGKRVVAAASLEGSSSSSPEKRPKQQLRASDYTLKMIVDVLFEIECEAQENPGIRRYTAACKCVSKRYLLTRSTFVYPFPCRCCLFVLVYIITIPQHQQLVFNSYVPTANDYYSLSSSCSFYYYYETIDMDLMMQLLRVGGARRI